ncbi:hypothetical protein [Microvirga tunisiensis]|uniref:Uncharacterized protein n=1 Tax=Microvirga tunisiensis TaxID=2108360 RepID=A0A5N7ME86_9HYPH|nr:hypothetical protein [Microvirga tunisiensis]MPR06962.1 hypothetical protein [Microvirga tunisiensis]MPR25193.1 hypothetical protein [Microvirga tunisiensis]
MTKALMPERVSRPAADKAVPGPAAAQASASQTSNKPPELAPPTIKPWHKVLFWSLEIGVFCFVTARFPGLASVTTGSPAPATVIMAVIMGGVFGIVALLIGAFIVGLKEPKSVSYYLEAHLKEIEKPIILRTICLISGSLFIASSIFLYKYNLTSIPLGLIEGMFWASWAFFPRLAVRLSGVLAVLVVCGAVWAKYSTIGTGPLVYSFLFYGFCWTWIVKNFIQKHSGGAIPVLEKISNGALNQDYHPRPKREVRQCSWFRELAT